MEDTRLVSILVQSPRLQTWTGYDNILGGLWVKGTSFCLKIKGFYFVPNQKGCKGKNLIVQKEESKKLYGIQGMKASAEHDVMMQEHSNRS